MFKKLRDYLIRTYGYTVEAPSYKGIHQTWTVNEALDWMKQYPSDTYVIISRNFRMVAMR